MTHRDMIPKKPIEPKVHIDVQPDKNGIYFNALPGIYHLFNYMHKNKMVAYMHVLLEGVVNQSKILNQNARSQAKDKWIVAKIMYMRTQPDRRREGLMQELIDFLKQFGGKNEVKYIISSAADSSNEGIKTLLKAGFVIERDMIIWRRDSNNDGK